MKSFLIALCFLLISSLGEAKDLYVNSSTGNDSTNYATNDANNPWLTLGRATWGNASRSSPDTGEAAAAGDTVWVAAGTYDTNQATGERYDSIYCPVNSGSAGSPITFKAVGTVTLTASTSGNGEPVIGSNGSKDYIVWDGFTIDEANINFHVDSGLVAVWGSDYVTIKNCNLKGAYTEFVSDNNHSCIRIESASGVTIENNYLWNITGNSGRNDAAITLYYATNVVIRHNDIHSNRTGIYVKGGPNPGPVDIYLNLFYSNLEAVALHAVTTGSFYQNVVRDCTTGINFFGFTGQGPFDFDVANNTVDNSSGRAVYLKGSCVYTNDIFWNNIVTNSSTVVYSEDCSTPGGIDFEHNNYYTYTTFATVNGNKTFAQWKTAFSQDEAAPASITSDPLYSDEAGNDFRLGVGSPCKNAGIDVLDLDGDSSTTDVIHMGAYVTGNELIGVEIVTVALSGTATVGINESDIVAGGKTLIFTITGDTFVATLGDNNSYTTDFTASMPSNRNDPNGWNNVVLAGLDHTHFSLNAGCTQYTCTLPAFGAYDIPQTEEKVTPDPPGMCLTSGTTPGYTTPSDFSIGVEASPALAPGAITGVGMVWSAQGSECVHDKDGVEVAR